MPDQPGFPVHAGIDRFSAACQAMSKRFPRTCGDRPVDAYTTFQLKLVSPYMRG